MVQEKCTQLSLGLWVLNTCMQEPIDALHDLLVSTFEPQVAT